MPVKVQLPAPKSHIKMGDMPRGSYGKIISVGSYCAEIVHRTWGDSVVNLSRPGDCWSWTDGHGQPELWVELFPPKTIITIEVE